MDPRSSDVAAGELEAFAAAVAHELRTPLSALSGEVELALRRDRTHAGYREALSRIARSIGELIELTGDLSLLGDPAGAAVIGRRTARLDHLLAQITERYRTAAPDVVLIDRAGAGVLISGDERLLTRALSLVVDHAVRYRRDGAGVRMRTAPPDDLHAGSGPVDLVVDAVPNGFLPHAWEFLAGAAADAASGRRTRQGPLRLRTAERIVRDCGGSLRVSAADGLQRVEIHLMCAEVA
jgi:two-component system OmpR family sensor kinase